jgi:pSer/pThr/pTyr-binding forkhead associated (FHA) protein
MPKFMVFFEGKPLNTYMIDEPVITIGRLPENTISIANMGVSRRHIRIEEDADRKFICTDLNSLNGTTVNGKRVKKVPLNSGDKITIGKFTIIYEENVATPGAMAPQYAAPAAPPTQTPHPAAPPASQPAAKKASDTTTIRKKAALPADKREPPRSVTQKAPVQRELPEESTPTLIDTTKHFTYKIDKPYMTIGNGDADDIPISGFMVGENQAFLEWSENAWRIGTTKLMGKLKVNGRAVKSHALKHKDRIDIGASSFRFMENG